MERKLIAVAVSTALGLPLAADAVEVALSGQVNRAVVVIDQEGNANDGVVQHSDSSASGSRLEFKGSGELDNGLTAGFHAEYSIDGYGLRHSNAYIVSEGGKVTVGQGSVAADNMAHARLGGPSWLGGVTNWCSYFSEGPGCKTHDGNRQGVVRYDTPAIGPLSVAVSVGNDEYWDGQAKVAGSFGDSGYDLRLGYIGDNGSEQDVIGASGAVKFAQGTAIAVAWGQNADAETESQYIELDHSYGAGSIGVSYRQGEDGEMTGSTWSVGVGHALGNGAHAYAGYRFVEGDDQEDAAAFFAGMRVRFN